MTKENYTTLTNEELVQRIRGLNLSTKKMSKSIKYGKQHPLIDEMIYRTAFLNSYFEEKNAPVPVLARLYCLEHNLHEHPVCQNPNCRNKVDWNVGKQEFSHHCCCACSGTDPEVQKTLKNTVEQKYNVQHVFQSEKVKEKSRQTCMRKYGVDNPSKSEQVIDKIRQTNLTRHGVEWYMQSNDFKEKAKISMISRFDVEHPIQSNEIKQKIKETNRKKYGVDYAIQSEDVLNKAKQTNLNKRGVEWNMQSEEVKQKSRKTNLERRGCENPMQSQEVQNKCRRTCEQRYGVQYVTQTQWFKEQSQKSCEQRYGVRNYSQTREFHSKIHKSYTNPKYPNMKFGSSWEFLVYDFLIEHNIQFEYHPKPIPYEYDGETHYYFPDFRINGRIYEVKGDNFFRINEETGKEEMYCTWRDPNLSNEEYEWKCNKEEAKHQCMIANNVVILRYSQIKNLTIEFFT